MDAIYHIIKTIRHTECNAKNRNGKREKNGNGNNDISVEVLKNSSPLAYPET
ncbi:MAG TPA: hypothetical protein VH500_04680 [Nitrososphaeraceae archaeon]